MKTKRYIICFFVLLFVSLPLIAQNRDRINPRGGRDSMSREAFMAQRNTFISKKMGLTTEETAIFIPLENEWFRKTVETELIHRRLERELRNKRNKTDEDHAKLLKYQEDVKEKQYLLEKEYLEKYKKILSAEKILKYKDVERNFRDEFMRERNKR